MGAVQIIWSLTNGGSQLSQPVDHGNNNSSNTLGPVDIHLRHTGINPITGCFVYIRAYSGIYSGDHTAATDFNEIISWGNGTSAPAFGGFQFSMNGNMPDFTNKNSLDGLGYTFRTGYGDNSTNAISLKKEIYSAGGVNGEIPAGAAPNARFQARMIIPTTPDAPFTNTTPGVRLFEQVLKFTFTT